MAASSGRKHLALVLKIAVAALLLGWLVRSGALDFGALWRVVRTPKLLAADLVGWALCALVLAVVRWRLLLGLVGANVPVARALALQGVALFFNVVIPGNVGGDVVKAVYVARDEPKEKRPAILMLVLVERLLGLAGLVATGLVVVAPQAGELWGDARFRPMIGTLLGLAGACLVAPAVFLVLVRVLGERLERPFAGKTGVLGLVHKLVLAARLLASRPTVLVGAVVVSMGMHAIGIGLFTLFARELTHQDVSLAAIATVFPTGVLSMMLPVSPAGLGVGHVAFDRLFAGIGLSGGATVFNVYLLGQIVPNLFGVVPYLSLRRTLPTDEEATRVAAAAEADTRALHDLGTS